MLNDFLLLMKQELVVTLIIFLLLFIRLAGKEGQSDNLLTWINVLLVVNLALGFFWIRKGSLFGDMFHTDPLLTLEKNILNLAVLIISLQSHSWLRTHKHVTEFYMLLLSTLLGMFFMLSSNNLLMFYLGLELSSIPLAAMANFDLEKRKSSEAGMKYILSSAFSSGLLLFGISLLYGATGSLNYEELAVQLTQLNSLHLFSFVLIFAGFGFKISAVPFHLWTADVYEGAPVAVTAYLSVVSKGAVLFVLVSVLYNLFRGLDQTWYHLLFLLSVLTMIIGNLFALRQQNMKRFLAFSSIAQVGFILIGISGESVEGSSSVIYFIMVYVFSNLAAFGVISLVSAATGRENVDDYKGFYRTNPLLSWVLAIALFSLAGIPPTAGFFGKFFLLLAGAGKANYWLITIAALNMVVSLYYYLRVIKAIFMDTSEYPIERVPASWSPRIAMLICVAGIIATGLMSGAYNYVHGLFK